MQGKILLVEDDEELRRGISVALTENDFEVFEVGNCLDALVALDNDNPDLVILDESLPMVDGWEAAYLLNHACGLPVMVIGSSAGPEPWVRMIESGADFYLRIPFTELELTARARAILRRYQQNKIIYQA